MPFSFLLAIAPTFHSNFSINKRYCSRLYFLAWL
nr:MAG TPA: hypothetical protein [Caudoviricetes sp.]